MPEELVLLVPQNKYKGLLWQKGMAPFDYYKQFVKGLWHLNTATSSDTENANTASLRASILVFLRHGA